MFYLLTFRENLICGQRHSRINKTGISMTGPGLNTPLTLTVKQTELPDCSKLCHSCSLRQGFRLSLRRDTYLACVVCVTEVGRYSTIVIIIIIIIQIGEVVADRNEGLPLSINILCHVTQRHT